MNLQTNKTSKPKSPFSRTRRLAATLGRFVAPSLRFAGQTISESLAQASNEDEVRELLRSGNEQRPSGYTRRLWLRIAKQRRTSFMVRDTLAEEPKESCPIDNYGKQEQQTQS